MMSQAGVNIGFAKCFIFFMAAAILLQGCGYLALSIWGIILRQCTNTSDAADISSQPFHFILNLIYFLNKECGSPNITLPINQETVTLNISWDDSYKLTHRTYIFLLTYTAISATWIITSLLVISSICGPVSKTVACFCFGPWFLVIIAGSIVDAVATGYHVNDVIQTVSAEKTLDYVGASTSNDDVMKFLKNYDAYFITPAVVMSCISSRIILIWLLNIFGSAFCLSLSRLLAKPNSSSKSSVSSGATDSTAPLPRTPVVSQTKRERSEEPQTTMPNDEQRRVPLRQSSKLQEDHLIKPKPLQVQNVHSLQREPSIIAKQQAENAPSAPLRREHPTNEQTITIHSTNANPDRLDYTSSPITQILHQQQLSTETPLNYRYITTSENYHTPSSNPRVSEELRGQLPWSYINTQPSNQNNPTRRATLQTYPEIPLPDYERH
uniref:Uncharacterized protein n=1 Tax=Glossina pallidipes TaxID=7398 RepID=A0A1B0AG17_GLOPL